MTVHFPLPLAKSTKLSVALDMAMLPFRCTRVCEISLIKLDKTWTGCCCCRASNTFCCCWGTYCFCCKWRTNPSWEKGEIVFSNIVKFYVSSSSAKLVAVRRSRFGSPMSVSFQWETPLVVSPLWRSSLSGTVLKEGLHRVSIAMTTIG